MIGWERRSSSARRGPTSRPSIWRSRASDSAAETGRTAPAGERGADPEDGDEHRCERAARDRSPQQAVERTEHAAANGIGSGALQQREAGRVDERVPDAQHRERGERDPGLRDRTHHDERGRPTP